MTVFVTALARQVGEFNGSYCELYNKPLYAASFYALCLISVYMSCHIHTDSSGCC